MKTILVTGATGFLGEKICLDFIRKNYKVIGIGRNKEKGESLFNRGVKFIDCDITRKDILGDVFKEKIDIVIHSAALSSQWGRREDFFNVNVYATKTLIKLCKKNNVKEFLYISSPSIYFNLEDGFNLDENTKVAIPYPSTYTETKYKAEELILKSIDKNFKAIILRPRAFFGPGDNTLIPRLMKAYNSGRLKIIGNGNNQIDLTYIDNIVHATELAINKMNELSGEAFNITNDEPQNLWNFINKVFIELGKDPIKKKVNYKLAYSVAYLLEIFHRLFLPNNEPVITRYSCSLLAKSQTLNIDKAKDLLGYRPVVSMEEGFNNYINWYKRENND